MKLTLPKVGSWSPPGLPKTQSSITGVKTPCIGVLFISMKRSWSVDVQNGLAWAIWTFATPSYGQKKGKESNWQFDSRPLKVKNRPESDVFRRSATWRWKALKESYKISLDLILIGGLSKKLWLPKVLGVQTRTVSGLHFGSLGNKCHLDVASAKSCKEYYMGEGGGFLRVRAVLSQVSPSCPWLVPTPGVSPMWTNPFVVGLWMQNRVRR
jgi:hypothetical protein